MPGCCRWVSRLLVAIAIGPDIIPFRAIDLEFFFGVAACLAVRYGRAPKALMLAVLPLVGLAICFENRVIFELAVAFLIAPLAAITYGGRCIPRKA